MPEKEENNEPQKNEDEVQDEKVLPRKYWTPTRTGISIGLGLIITVLIILCIVIVSQQKEEDPSDRDTTAPKISLTSPEENSIYATNERLSGCKPNWDTIASNKAKLVHDGIGEAITAVQ